MNLDVLLDNIYHLPDLTYLFFWQSSDFCGSFSFLCDYETIPSVMLEITTINTGSRSGVSFKGP